MAAAALESPPPAEAPTSPSPSSSNPLKLLSTLDPSKKYTLVFLVSVGTTLLLTGASGGRLLKRAKASTASPTPAPTPAPKAASAPLPVPRPPPVSASSTLPPAPFFANPNSVNRPRSVLRSWRVAASPSPLPATGAATAYFLPNATLLSASSSFATALDQADRLHKDGVEPEGEILDDGFNPAVFAAKAFAIATGLTVGAFAVAIGGVMAWLGVSDVSRSAEMRWTVICEAWMVGRGELMSGDWTGMPLLLECNCFRRTILASKHLLARVCVAASRQERSLR
jgi:hypothetical protein